jgi:hypothetical protein
VERNFVSVCAQCRGLTSVEGPSNSPQFALFINRFISYFSQVSREFVKGELRIT